VRNKLDRLCGELGYQFKHKDYLKQALTHCSAGSDNYERFEFLGDSILSFVIAHELFNKFPNHSEGELSRLRSFLVRGDMLTDLATELNLGDCLYLGQGELKSGGFRRASILADAMEAVFAAIFLDGGIVKAQQVILNLYRSRLDEPQFSDCLKDAKTQLQEYLQAEKYPLPSYQLIKIEGENHHQVFHVQCSIEKLDKITQGQGVSRRKAEQSAAQAMLNLLQ
jgi:ribonuclease-3